MLISYQRSLTGSVAWFADPARRIALAALFALTLVGARGVVPQTALAYNCVNVVLRDPYWGQYRRIVESGWNAAGIGSAFARSGFAVNNAPQVGDIMVWPPNYFGASSTGHVGVVAAVHGNGTVTVRHENWPFGSAEHAQVFTVLAGHQFVHRPGAAVIAAPEPAVAVADVAQPETDDNGGGNA